MDKLEHRQSRKSFSIASISAGLLACLALSAQAQTTTVKNPFLWADIPDPSIVRVGDAYYMSYTTMHLAPGVPILKSTDLANWRTVGYAYSTLADNDAMNLANGKNAYGKGSWAASLRYKDGKFHVLVPSYTTGKTHLYTTANVEKGPWTEVQFPFYHDPSLHLGEDGRNFVVYGANDIRIVELNSTLTGVKSGGVSKILIPKAQSMVGDFILNAEGAHIEKIDGWYYVFLITWPRSGYDGRTELVWRSRTIDGTYEGKVVHSSKGVAQGSVVQDAKGAWWGYLFQDNGSVGRSPWIMPVTWSNGWPVFNGGTSPTSVAMETHSATGTGIVTSDDFETPAMKLEWQWNHNPDNANWSLSARPGHYRIKTSRVDAQVVNARNTLSQKSFGPKSSGRIALDASGMKDGDVAGLSAFQAGYGYVGVKKSGTSNSIVMVNAPKGAPTEVASVPVSQNRVFLRVDMDFTNRTDKATFYYSLDSATWKQIGNTLQMSYTLDHFMGYRFALFNFATKAAGGHADFDWFKIGSTANESIDLYRTAAIGGDIGRQARPGRMSLGSVVSRSGRELSIGYEVEREGRVEIFLAAPDGRILETLVDRRHAQGAYDASCRAAQLPRGRYLVLARFDGAPAQAVPVVLVE